MTEKIIVEGKTQNEAIEKGLKQLNVSKDKVNIKVLENEEKRSFFSILAPRVVKVELTLKDEKEIKENKEEIKKENKIYNVTNKDIENAKQNLENFLNEFTKKMPENTTYNIKNENNILKIELKNENIGFLIGYRGEVLNSLQTIISSIANRNTENRVKVIVDVENYKEKREQTLIELADKIAKTVVRTGKSITLEPMQAYERKIIHSRLQENRKVQTRSIGEEPRRRIVVSLKYNNKRK